MGAHPISIHIAAKGLHRSPPWALSFGEGEQMGANREYFYTRLYGPHHLWGRVREGSRELREQRGVKGVNMEQRE